MNCQNTLKLTDAFCVASDAKDTASIEFYDTVIKVD